MLFYILFLCHLCFSVPVYLDTFNRKFLHKRNCLLLHHCYCPTHTSGPCITVVILYSSWLQADLLPGLMTRFRLRYTHTHRQKLLICLAVYIAQSDLIYVCSHTVSLFICCEKLQLVPDYTVCFIVVH